MVCTLNLWGHRNIDRFISQNVHAVSDTQTISVGPHLALQRVAVATGREAAVRKDLDAKVSYQFELAS